MIEEKWQSVDRTGTRPASRADLLTVLSNLQYILIRASLLETVYEVQISDVSLDTAVQQQTGQRMVLDVEVCMCPEGYRGTSCEVSCLALIFLTDFIVYVKVVVTLFNVKIYDPKTFDHFYSHVKTIIIVIHTIVPLVSWVHVNVARALKMLNLVALEAIIV